MFRKLFILSLLVGAVSAQAQVAITPIKSPEKKTEPAIDYKLPGAPMPGFRMLKCVDSTKHGSGIIVQSDAEETKTTKKKSRHSDEKKEAVPKDAKYLTSADLDNGANLFIMMFNPTCSHCIEQTKLMEKNIGMFKRSKLVLMANPGMWDYMPNFIRDVHPLDYAPVSVGIDSADFIGKVFLYSALPQINIYDKDRKLIRAYSGEVSIDSLSKYIQ